MMPHQQIGSTTYGPHEHDEPIRDLLHKRHHGTIILWRWRYLAITGWCLLLIHHLITDYHLTRLSLENTAARNHIDTLLEHNEALRLLLDNANRKNADQ